MSGLFYILLAVLLIGTVFTSVVDRPKLLCRFAAFGEDDSDMKIAGALPFGKPSSPEADRASDMLERQRKNGNVERARDLGVTLSELLGAEAKNARVPEVLGLDPDLFTGQRSILQSFSIKVALEARLIDFLEDIAFNVFMEQISDHNEDLYADIRSAQEFTLYLLCMRGADPEEYSVGRVFARLCGHEGNERLEAFGELEYRRFLRFVEQEIRRAGFSDQDGPVLL